jgi:hypothetical protein
LGLGFRCAFPYTYAAGDDDVGGLLRGICDGGLRVYLLGSCRGQGFSLDSSPFSLYYSISLLLLEIIIVCACERGVRACVCVCVCNDIFSKTLHPRHARECIAVFTSLREMICSFINRKRRRVKRRGEKSQKENCLREMICCFIRHAPRRVARHFSRSMSIISRTYHFKYLRDAVLLGKLSPKR